MPLASNTTQSALPIATCPYNSTPSPLAFEDLGFPEHTTTAGNESREEQLQWQEEEYTHTFARRKLSAQNPSRAESPPPITSLPPGIQLTAEQCTPDSQARLQISPPSPDALYSYEPTAYLDHNTFCLDWSLNFEDLLVSQPPLALHRELPDLRGWNPPSQTPIGGLDNGETLETTVRH